MSNPARFDAWPWRDFGHFGMTRKQAVLEATYAAAMAQQVRLPGYSDPWMPGNWVPWERCDHEAYRAAGIGASA